LNLFLSPKFKRDLKKLTRNDSRLASKIETKLELLITNKNHPSLRLHKLTGKDTAVWSISVTSDLRVLFTYMLVGLYLIAIGGHDDVY